MPGGPVLTRIGGANLERRSRIVLKVSDLPEVVAELREVDSELLERHLAATRVKSHRDTLSREFLCGSAPRLSWPETPTPVGPRPPATDSRRARARPPSRRVQQAHATLVQSSAGRTPLRIVPEPTQRGKHVYQRLVERVSRCRHRRPPSSSSSLGQQDVRSLQRPAVRQAQVESARFSFAWGARYGVARRAQVHEDTALTTFRYAQSLLTSSWPVRRTYPVTHCRLLMIRGCSCTQIWPASPAISRSLRLVQSNNSLDSMAVGAETCLT